MNVIAPDADGEIVRSSVSRPVVGRPDDATTRGSRPSGAPAMPILAILGLGGFALLTVLVGSGFVFPFDQPLLDAGRNLSQYLPAWRGLSDSANLPLIAIGVAIVAWLLLTRQRTEAVLVIGVLATVTAGSEAVKQLIARPRPPAFDNSVMGVVYSFPSGHVLEATTIYGIISVLLWRSTLPRFVRVAVPIVFATVIGLVAIARVAVGAHYPSDVLAGLVGGIGVVALFAWLTARLARRHEASSTAVGG
jgi:undecaprenyl-diphosphatase